MRNGFHTRAARVAAMTALGWAVVPPGEAADAQFLDDFWRDAWKATYTPDASGMTLRDTGVEGRWSVDVHGSDGVLATGEYDELVRLPAHGLEDAGGMLQHFVTAGLFAGPTGVEVAVVGLSQRVVLPEASIDVTGFTPLRVVADGDEAMRDAARLHAMLSGLPAAAGDGNPQYSPGDCWCTEMMLNALNACDLQTVGCEAACTAVAIAALAGCMALGPLAATCMALVLAALSACIAACLAEWQACRVLAANDFLQCLESCLDERDGADPGITP